MNDGVKIVCDKILEHPHITDPNSNGGEERRWMHFADFIIENDFGTFDQADVDAVKSAIREARQKYFTASVLDHVMWETEPQKTKSHPFDYPSLPKSQKVMAEERAETIRAAEKRAKFEEMEMEHRMKAQMGMRGQNQSSQYGLLGKGISQGLF